MQTCSSRRRKEEERGGSRLGGSSSSLSQILASWKITTGGSRYTRFKIHKCILNRVYLEPVIVA